MWTKLRIGIFGLITILCSCINVDKNIEEAPNKFSEYIGRYQLNTNLVIEVLEEKGQLQIRPSFWRIARRIDSLGIDSFSFRNTTTIQFQRDSMGQITSLVSSGHRELEGTSLKLAKNDYQPVELLISGKTEEAIKKLKENSGKNPEATITSMAFSFIRNYPSRSDECNKFISSFETLLPNSVDLYQIKGLSSLLSNDRITALHAFERAFEIDSSDNLTKSSLRLLGSKYSTPPPSNSWKLPFSIDQLFSAPTKDEIERVKKDWNNRNLKIDEPEIVVEDTIMLWDLNYQVKIIRHKIYGKIHYGAVLIPEGAPKKKSPLIIEARGVDPEYSPKDITQTEAYIILDKNELNAVIAIPCFRGNSIYFNDQEYKSEGSPTDAWDGATDDAIAFLNVVLDIIPEVDSNRIAAFGQSRGGTVALLLGIRDDRIQSVADWAGPSGWYDNMGTFGWTLKDQVQWGLWERWSPGNGWGSSSQFIEWYLKSTIEKGSSSLEEIRHKMLASSPLYFIDDLPTAQLHYGKEDRYVPYSNAIAIKNKLIFRNNIENGIEVFIHKNTGHDQPYPKAYKLTNEFLLNNFSKINEE